MPKKSRQEQKAETYANLFQAGIQLFAKKGILKTRPQDVAKLAGVSIGSFYSHFKDKHALQEEITLSFTRELTGYVTEVMVNSQFDSLEEIVHTHFTAIIDFYEKYPEWAKVQSECKGLDTKNLNNQIKEATRDHVNRLYDRFLYRTDVKREVVIQAEMGMINYVIDWWIHDHSAIDKEGLVNSLVRIALEGIYSEKT